MVKPCPLQGKHSAIGTNPNTNTARAMNKMPPTSQEVIDLVRLPDASISSAALPDLYHRTTHTFEKNDVPGLWRERVLHRRAGCFSICLRIPSRARFLPSRLPLPTARA